MAPFVRAHAHLRWTRARIERTGKLEAIHKLLLPDMFQSLGEYLPMPY